jgi:hypothetical protein
MSAGSSRGAQQAQRDASASAASSADDKKRKPPPVDNADSGTESIDSDYVDVDESDDSEEDEDESSSESDLSGDEEVRSGRAAYYEPPPPPNQKKAKNAAPKANSRVAKRKAKRLARFKKDPAARAAHEAAQARWTAELASTTPTRFQHEWADRPYADLSAFATPLAAFQTYFTAEVVAGILRHTIDYADGGFDARPLETPELLAFFGSLILLGIVDYPSVELTFSESLGFDRIKHIWSRARFEQIFSSLHFSKVVRRWSAREKRLVPDARGEKAAVKRDRLYKIRELHDQLRALFSANYIPGECLALDESMCKNHHNTPMQQYCPAKPTKRGIKFWVIVDARRRIVLDFEIYIGATDNDWDDVGTTANIVLRLERRYFGTNRKIYFDRFYNSIELQDALATHGLYGCGTVNPTRVGLPEDCVDWAGGERGEYIVRQSGDLVCAAWMDTKTVLFLGRTADATKEVMCDRRSGAAVRRVPQPALAADYNKHYKGVDVCDQNASYYLPNFKTTRFYINIFLQLFAFSIVNARVLHNLRRESRGDQPLTNLEFRMQLADELIGDFSARRSMGPSRATPSPEAPKQKPTEAAVAKAAGPHYLVRAPKKGRCQRCANDIKSGRVGSADGKSQSARAPRSSYWCEHCNVHFCVERCFNEHRQQHEQFLYSKK